MTERVASLIEGGANPQGLTEGVRPAVFFLRLLAEMTFPVTTPFREKASPKRPQSFRRCKIENNSSSDIAKANAAAILNGFSVKPCRFVVQ